MISFGTEHLLLLARCLPSLCSVSSPGVLAERQVGAELAEGNGGRCDLRASRSNILSLGTVWEQSVQSVHGQRQITLAQCSKFYFILKPGTNASENKWQVYLH